MKRRNFLHTIAGVVGGTSLTSRVGMADWDHDVQKTTGPVHVGSDKQLFADGTLITNAQRVSLAVNRPTLGVEKCIIPEKPWEGFGIGGYNSVMEDGGVLKMWYDSTANDGTRWCCYATSADGVHWDKPNLGIVSFQGSRENNIVFPPAPISHEPNCVFRDTNPSCPDSERFKMVASLEPKAGKPGVYVASSADGLHWKMMKDSPAFRPSDTNNICFYDAAIGHYVAYVRVWDAMRKVGRCVFDDITNWGNEEIVFSYDWRDQEALDGRLFAGMDFYTSAAVRYPHARNVYLMFPSAYYRYQPAAAQRIGSVHPKNDGPLDIQFATSSDGIAWKRLDRKPWIGRGVVGGPASGTAYMASGMVMRSEEVWLYYLVQDHTHGNYDYARDKFTGTIMRARVRLDGFVSVDTDYDGGEFTTPPLISSGQKLKVNADTGAGGCLCVEILPESGMAIKGFAEDDCDPVNGNYVNQTVSWRGQADVGRLAGQPIRLRFVMNRTKLYSFNFEA